MQMVDIPSNEGLIVDDEPNYMSIALYSKASTRTLNIDLDDYSPSPKKESQEHDVNQEAKFSYFPPHPPHDDGTPEDTDETNISEPKPERIRLTAQMTTDAQVKKLKITIEDFNGTTTYIKGQVIRNMRQIETLDLKIQNTIEDHLSLMYQKIDDFLQSLSNLDSVYEAKLDHLQSNITAQDRYIATLEKSVAEFSKASESSSTTPFQAFREKVQC
ncbi:unnamed protein product [Lactuca virosa]|uniref:Uncharacterized protein n=1 Tax=Lactuca virosa TaxID=75947 RepID=A0AAU9P2H9_9ASTR|nr:unnamed protein product [Lactuca virosa]